MDGRELSYLLISMSTTPIKHTVHSGCHSAYNSATAELLRPSYRHTRVTASSRTEVLKGATHQELIKIITPIQERSGKEGEAGFCKRPLPQLSDKKCRFLPAFEKTLHIFCLDFNSLRRNVEKRLEFWKALTKAFMLETSDKPKKCHELISKREVFSSPLVPHSVSLELWLISKAIAKYRACWSVGWQPAAACTNAELSSLPQKSLWGPKATISCSTRTQSRQLGMTSRAFRGQGRTRVCTMHPSIGCFYYKV